MSSESPAAVLFDMSGNELPVQNGAAIPASTPMILVGGSDGANSRYFSVDTSGRIVSVGAGVAGTPAGGVLSIQGVSGGQTVPISGTISASQTGNIDAGNSSTTPLAGNGTFTGTAIDVSVYGVITVFVFTDQAGTLNLEFSTNNTNWDEINSYAVTASSALNVQFGPQAKFFRVVYQNGSSAQSTFRLQTIERPITSFPETVPVSYIIQGNDDAILTKSVITGKTTGGGGSYVDVKVNPSGTLTVDATNSTNVGITGTVTANQGTANTLANKWPVQVTDGTNTMPTGDVVGRAIFEKITDGTNTAGVDANNHLFVAGKSAAGVAPTGNPVSVSGVDGGGLKRIFLTDTGGRQFALITDGTNTAAVKAASTAATATDPSLVTAFSPNSPLPTGSNVIGAVTQSAGPWTENLTQVGGSAVTTLAAGEQKVAVEGLAASGAAVSGNPVYAGGKNPSGNAMGVITDAVGSLIGSSGANEFPIHVNSTITTSGSQTIVNNNFGAQQINLVVNVTTAPTGTTPTIQFTVQELDTGDNTTTFGNSSSTILINKTGVYTTSLYYSTSNAIKVSWTVTGASASFTGVYSTIISKVTQTALPAYNGAPSQSGTAFTTLNISVASTENIMRLLTYTQQTTNAQRSIVSTNNANDTSAGTGARQVTITYYDQNMQGPFTETLTLNGTTAVNTVGTNICFLENMVVTSVGSGGKNVGFINLFAGTGGTGAIMGEIAIGANITKYAHHYVATGKTCYIENLSMAVDGTTAVGGYQYLKWNNPASATSPIVVIGDTVRAWTNTTSVVRQYNPPLKIVGPALVAVYNVSDSSTSATYSASFDYYDQ